ncbi:hypothetical protein SEVIR_7G296703v4 [Setaria viridis]
MLEPLSSILRPRIARVEYDGATSRTRIQPRRRLPEQDTATPRGGRRPDQPDPAAAVPPAAMPRGGRRRGPGIDALVFNPASVFPSRTPLIRPQVQLCYIG